MQMLLEPEWQKMDDLPKDLPATLYSYITTIASLTNRLRELGELRLEVIKEYTEGLIWYRDVVLFLNSLPAVIGHSAIPVVSLEDPLLRSLKKLGTRPLGELIFTELKGQRELLEFAYIEPLHHLFHLANPYLQDEKKLYARRSIINVNQHKLIVQEVFLPTFFRSKK